MGIEKNISLKELTAFKIGGEAQFFCRVESEDDLLKALGFAQEKKVPFFILGGGSNILVSDKGFKGLVIKMEMKGISFVSVHDGHDGAVRVTVQAGEDWDGFVQKCVEKELYGIENLSLIPGTAGAAPVQNIGAYGSEVKDTIESVRVFDTKSSGFADMSNADCQFAYRDSIFKKEAGRFIIVSVTFILKKNGQVNFEYKDVKELFASQNIFHPTLAQVREAIVYIRTHKLPDVRKIGTVGSFFKNPHVTLARAEELKKIYPDLPIYPADQGRAKISLAWIIDHVCGFKGVSKGNVGTYKNQALVLVNTGNATANEVMAFAREIADSVKAKTGIVIEPEVQFVGEQ